MRKLSVPQKKAAPNLRDPEQTTSFHASALEDAQTREIFDDILKQAKESSALKKAQLN